jgi:hypothetical protein
MAFSMISKYWLTLRIYRRLSGGFAPQVAILIDQIATVVESPGPFQEIAAVAHQAGFESGEELNRRQALRLHLVSQHTACRRSRQ